MKSINQLLDEATEKVNKAYEADSHYCDIQTDLVRGDYNGSEDDMLNLMAKAFDEKAKALRKAIKAIKDLYKLFDIDVPNLRHLGDVACKLSYITYRWQRMNENIF